jgi:outer membrane protein assembly factor BamD
MSMFTLRSVPVVIALCALAACGLEPPKPGSTAKDPQSAYAEAKELLDNGSYESAITGYEQLEARFPYGRYAQQGQLDTAYAHYRLRETDNTVADCDRFIRLHPNHPNVDYAYYLKALAYENAKSDDWFEFLPQQPLAERDASAVGNAFQTFKIIVTRYPQSKYADVARTHMENLLEALASNELNAARYYLRRRAPLAAANRAQNVIVKYSTSKATEDALGIMIESYTQLKLDTLRADTERVLRQNFPDSHYLVANQ